MDFRTYPNNPTICYRCDIAECNNCHGNNRFRAKECCENCKTQKECKNVHRCIYGEDTGYKNCFQSKYDDKGQEL